MQFIFSKGFYKVISLFIKASILLLSFLYIYYKLNNTSIASITITFSGDKNLIYLIICMFLMLVNWGIEAVKWKMLINKVESISFLQSTKSIFAGITISIFTPNRIGEFAGKIFYLQKADKITATIISFIGSIAQLIITVIAGVIAFFIAKTISIQFENIFSTKWLAVFIFLCFVIFYLLFLLYKKRKSFSKLIKYIDIVASYSKEKITKVFLLSAIRYLVFSLQYYLVLLMFDINVGVLVSSTLIALVFFVSSAIPTFAITEIVVRGATAVYFFSFVSSDVNAIIASSLLLWIINIAIPSIVGSFFIWELKFFKD